MELEQAIDLACEQINLRNREYLGVDIGLHNVSHIEDELCRLFSMNGNIMTSEAKFNTLTCFCWGETKEKHRAWVNEH